jgi:hypothetical protein
MIYYFAFSSLLCPFHIQPSLSSFTFICCHSGRRTRRACCCSTRLASHLSRLSFSLPFFSSIYRTLYDALSNTSSNCFIPISAGLKCEIVLCYMPWLNSRSRRRSEGCRRDRWVILYTANASSGGESPMSSVSVNSHTSIMLDVRRTTYGISSSGAITVIPRVAQSASR